MTDRDQKIVDNIKLVYHVLKTRYPTYLHDDDMFQIGCVGLIRAIDTYDETKGIRFSSYAVACIQNQIRIELRAQNNRPQNVTSIYEVVYQDGSNPVTIEDLLPGGNQIDILESGDFIDSLTDRQKDIIRYMIMGYQQNEIAAIYKVSPSAIRASIIRIQEKYNRVKYKEIARERRYTKRSARK